jgi:hypothetical protein
VVSHTVAVPQRAVFRQFGGKRLRLVSNGAQRASRRPSIRYLRVFGPLLLAVVGLGLIPSVASAASIRVVVVVGPVESQTASYMADGRALAKLARSYGASVTEIYSPNATWSRVRAAANGANLFIYLGHGNGWPSPHAPFSTRTKDGLGLNASAGHGNSNLHYYGSAYIDGTAGFKLAADAVVILNHLCYSAGNSEPGYPLPSKSVAEQRIANYGQTFFRIGARAVFAEPRNSAAYILTGLFRSNLTMRQIFWTSRQSKHSYSFTFTSSKAPGMTAISDPYAPSRYYRSVIGKLDVRASTWR